MLSCISPQHYAQIKLWYLVQHSLTAYHKLIRYFGSVQHATEDAALKQWMSLPIHAHHKQRAEQFLTPTGQEQFQHCLQLLQQHCDFILSPEDADYPEQLKPHEDRPPLLFGQGQIHTLAQPQLAIVGSRKTSPHGSQIAYDFSHYLAHQGLYITSGLAYGVDYAAHQGGLQHQRTIAVIGTGIDQIYPAQHRLLHQQILAQNGTIITEFLPTTPPLQHHFPRRNRIISALSLGTLVVEAALKSGSLSTARWAMEQGKSVFAIPGHIYSEYHQGCHQLIREGAILVDHPEQIIQELQQPLLWQNLQKTFSTPLNSTPFSQLNTITSSTSTAPCLSTTPVTNSNLPDLPEHLTLLFQQLEWTGQDIDQLSYKTTLDITELTSQLMQLELLGVCIQQAGLYLRCR